MHGVARAATTAFFALIVFQLLFGPQAVHDKAGTALTWILWWPLLPIVLFLTGRAWCAVCPFAWVSDALQRLVGLERPVPTFLKRYGIWVIDAYVRSSSRRSRARRTARHARNAAAATSSTGPPTISA